MYPPTYLAQCFLQQLNTRDPWQGYGFCWGTNTPTCTPTPAKPVNLPQGFPYPWQSLDDAWTTWHYLVKQFKEPQVIRKLVEILLFLCLMTTCKSKNSFSNLSRLPFFCFFHFLFTFQDQFISEKMKKVILSNWK